MHLSAPWILGLRRRPITRGDFEASAYMPSVVGADPSPGAAVARRARLGSGAMPAGRQPSSTARFSRRCALVSKARSSLLATPRLRAEHGRQRGAGTGSRRRPARRGRVRGRSDRRWTPRRRSPTCTPVTRRFPTVAEARSSSASGPAPGGGSSLHLSGQDRRRPGRPRRAPWEHDPWGGKGEAELAGGRIWGARRREI